MTEKRTRRPGTPSVPARRDGKARPAPIAPARLVALEALMEQWEALSLELEG